MPIQELMPPTLAEVEKAIAAMERKYFPTAEFLGDAGRANEVDDDDAQEWRYLLMQKRAIKQHQRCRPYAGISGHKEYSEEDARLAQVDVAA